MKTALFSLIIAISVAVLSVFQFDRYQNFVNHAQANLKAFEDKTNLALNNLKDEMTKLKTAEQTMLAQAQNPSFKTAELEYLVRLANTRLQTMRDIKAAIQLLTFAQTKIQTLNDLSLSPLSEAIAKDLITLQQAPQSDLEDLWLQISSIMDTTATLSPQMLAATTPASQKEITTPALATEVSPNRLHLWKQRFFESLESMKDFIKIRHSEQPLEPILSETQKSLIQENLRSLLEQMRFAVLNMEDKIFQKTLAESQQWMSRYYDETDPVVKNVRQKVTELSAIQLRPELPLITAPDFFNTLR